MRGVTRHATLDPDAAAADGFDEAVRLLMAVPTEQYVAGFRVPRGLGLLRDL